MMHFEEAGSKACGCPNAYIALVNLAACHLNNKDFQKAVEAARQLVALHPKRAQAWFQLATVLGNVKSLCASIEISDDEVMQCVTRAERLLPSEDEELRASLRSQISSYKKGILEGKVSTGEKAAFEVVAEAQRLYGMQGP